MQINEGQHYQVLHHLDHGWEWQGIRGYDSLKSDRIFPSAALARADAERAVNQWLSQPLS